MDTSEHRHPGVSSDVADISDDGTTVYAADLIWDFAPARLRSVACDLAGRNLTAEEWDRYLDWAGPRRATCPQYPLG